MDPRALDRSGSFVFPIAVDRRSAPCLKGGNRTIAGWASLASISQGST